MALAARPRTADERIALMERQIEAMMLRTPAPQVVPAPFTAQAGQVLEVRVSELPPANQLNLGDLLEVSQLSVTGTPTTRRGTIDQLVALAAPNLSPFLTGIVGGAGITVVGSAPVPTVSLAGVEVAAGTYGDGEHVAEVTVDEFGRVTNIALVPITPTEPPDLSHLAPLDSPEFVGTPTAPTQEEDTATDALATCSFVQQAIALGASITVGFAPPTAPRPNQLWWHSRFGQLFIFFNDGESSQWVPASPAVSNVQIPPGTVNDFAGLTAPAGWYLCDGASKDRLLDAPLFAAIGTLYGDGDGGEDATTFSLPDLRGRVTAMVDGGSERLTSIDDEVGAAGGAETHALSWSEMPAHSHGVSDPGHGHSSDIGGGAAFATLNSGQGFLTNVVTANGDTNVYFSYATAAAGTDITLANSGSGAAHANVQPTLVMNKMIKR